MSAEVNITFDEAKVERAVRKAAADAINLAAIDLSGKLRTTFGGGTVGKLLYRLGLNKLGVMVRKRTTKNKYGASPVGTPPGVRSGRLRNSITVAKATVSNLFAVIGTNISYGKFHEFGYVGKARNGKLFHVPARPWAVPTLNRNKETLMKIMAEEFQSSLASAMRDMGVKQK